MASGVSYNGWAANSNPAAIGVVPFHPLGVTAFASGGFPTGVRGGDVAVVFTYLVEQLHARVEPMMTDPNTGQLGYGCWAYQYRANVNNPSQLSCHASGTAIDYNAPRHNNGTSTGPQGGGGWSGAQYFEVRKILNECGGVVRWLTGNDPMHFEIIGSAADVTSAANRLRRDNIPGRPVDPTPPTPPAIPDVPDTDWLDTVDEATLRKIIREEVLDVVRLEGVSGGGDLARNVPAVAAGVWAYRFPNEWGQANSAEQFVRAIDGKVTAPDKIPQPTPPATYTVAPGDTVSGIAKRFGITAEQLRGWNGLDPAKDADLRIGLTLKVSA